MRQSAKIRTQFHQDKMRGSSYLSYYLAAAAIWAAVQLPFLNTAFRIDEPLVLFLSEQIRRFPFNPYGLNINWLGDSQAASAFYSNPPFLPYWISMWSCLFPSNEISLHLAVLPFSFLSLHGFDMIAKTIKVNRVLSAVMLACSPAFFLASQVIMPDIAMFSFLVCSIGYALVYDRGGRKLPLIAATLAGFLSPLAKYNGLILIPIIAIIWIFSRKRTGIALIMAAPLLSTALWCIWSWILYGQPHFYATIGFQHSQALPLFLIMIGTTCAIGMAVLPVSALFFYPDLYREKKVIPVLGCFTIPYSFLMGLNIRLGILPATLFALAILISLHLLVITLWQGVQGFKSRDMTRILLVVWVIAGLFSQLGLMFSSVRYVLFLSPPLILILLLSCHSLPQIKVLAGPAIVSFCFVMALSTADSRIAEAYRWIIRNFIQVSDLNNKGNLFFSGHWGLQYYAQQSGGTSVDPTGTENLSMQAGDILIVAKTAWPTIIKPSIPSGKKLERIQVSFDPHWLLRTIDCTAAANFYSCLNSGCSRPALLPYGFARGPSELFDLYVLR